MNKITQFNSKTFAAVAPYSTAYEANGLVFFSGQIPLDPETKEVVKGDISVTATRVLDNIKLLLNEASLNIENILKCTIFLTDMSDFKAFNAVYGQVFSQHKPARTCIAVKELPLGVNVEIEFIACRN